jgi:hypothetical protein
MATVKDQTIHTGSSILLMIANKVVGRAQGVDGRRSFGTEGLYEIGSIMPQEHVYNRYEGSVSVERFYVKKKSLKDLGLASLGEDVLQLSLIDIVVISKENNSIIRAYRGCSIAEYSETFRANAIAV